MNFRNILSEIEQAEPGVYEQIKGRRQVLKTFGVKAAVAALPLVFSSVFNKAKASGKTTDATPTPVQVLNFVLELEYFAYNYYHIANNTGGLIPASDQAGFLTVENQKKAHINYLNATITTLGGTPYTPKNYDPTSANPLFVVSGAYDFTAGGTYAVFNDYPTFIMFAEVFEDTFVHAYIGQTPNALGNSTLLAQLLQMQSVVARHASYARLVRRFLGFASAPEHPAPWITNNIPPMASLQSYYNGEETSWQENQSITSLPGLTGTTPMTAATAAFDEPLDVPTVLTSLTPFML